MLTLEEVHQSLLELGASQMILEERLSAINAQIEQLLELEDSLIKGE